MSTLRARLEVLIGPRATTRLLREIGGTVVRVPHTKGSVTARRARNLAIIALLETSSRRRIDATPSLTEVAEAFELTRRQVINIAKRTT